MILLLAAAIGSAVQAENRTDTSLFMKEDSSVMEMISAGVPYQDRKVDILVRVTVKSGERFADVEAEVLSGAVPLVGGLSASPGV